MANDGSKIPIVALVDSGCSGSLIDESFVREKGFTTYKLPEPISIYNTNGSPNSNGSISKFVMIELNIGEHSECLALAVTKLSTHPIFLGYDWLKEHNQIIDWKTQTMKFTCDLDHLPNLIPEEDEDEDVGYQKDEERLFRVDIESYIRTNTSTELAIEANKGKNSKTFEAIVPDHYHEYKNIFDKENFDELPLCRPWDHAIELLPGDHVVDCKTYNLTLSEQRELDEFLEENLKTG